MDEKIREILGKMVEEGNDLEKRLRICMYEPKGIRVETLDSEKQYWFNKAEDLEFYDDLIGVYKRPNENGLSRISHGLCSVHEHLLGTNY